MKRILLILAELFLGLIILAIITNLIAGFVDLPLWQVLSIGLVAFVTLAVVTIVLRQPFAGQAPVTLSPNQAHNVHFPILFSPNLTPPELRGSCLIDSIF